MNADENQRASESDGAIRVEDTSEKENMEPPAKKPRLEVKKHPKLETRLNDILSCTVCLDLPKKVVFQVRLTVVFKHITLVFEITFVIQLYTFDGLI